MVNELIIIISCSIMRILGLALSMIFTWYLIYVMIMDHALIVKFYPFSMFVFDKLILIVVGVVHVCVNRQIIHF